MSVWTGRRGTTGRTYLGTLGKVSGLQWETTLPGGDRSARWSMRIDSNADLPELRQGNLVGITVGGVDVWTGDLSEPEPNGPFSRTFTADGSAVELSRYFASYPVNVWLLQGVVEFAQARGMSIRPGALQDAPYGQVSDNDGSKMVDQVVNEVADLLGLTWQVRGGAVSLVDYPTAVDYIVLARDQGSRSLNDFVTRLVVRYDDGTTGVSFTLENGQGYRGDREALLDLTGNGVLTSGEAEAIGAAELARRGVRTKFSSPLVVGRGDVFTPGGSPVDPLTLRAGCVVSVQQLDVSRGGETNGAAPEVLIGSVTCDLDTASAVLTPFDFSGKTIASALAGAFRRPGFG